MAQTEQMVASFHIKEPKGLSPRIQWLRDYFFKGVSRPWNNEYTCWSTGTPWDVQYDEITYYIVPETYAFLQTFRGSIRQASRPISLEAKFWTRSLPERRAWFNREVMVNHVPQEILPGDLLAGARFNVQTSRCWSEKELKERDALVYGPTGARASMKWFHDHGYGNAGATSGHIIPDYETILRIGWEGIHGKLEQAYASLGDEDKKGPKGAELRAMITASTMARDVAAKYHNELVHLAAIEQNDVRKAELLTMAGNLERVPWKPAHTFWEAVQSLWLTHMLVMSDENYPGPGVSFGLLDRMLLPYWEESRREGMDREWGKEILKCFWVHCNFAYDAQMRVGANQGITAGFGQLFNLSGIGPDGKDATSDLTYAFLEVLDDMSPILEPKPNVRLHRDTPEKLLDKVVDMIAGSQGAPFLLNFDERSMAGMMREAKSGHVEKLIDKENVNSYASVGCLENTMVGNDRSGTVDCNLNLLKAVELTLAGGRDLLSTTDGMTGKVLQPRQDSVATGDPTRFHSWDQFWQAYITQTKAIVKRITELYEKSESIRARYSPTPYLSCLVRACMEKGLDVTQGGAELSFVTVEGVTFATTVDSLLAIKDLVFDAKAVTMEELVTALRDNWKGHEILQARAKNKTPKYGQDDERADAMARAVMELWSSETWNYRTTSTGRQYRPGMLSWNYWVGDGYVMAASADGRPQGQFLSNAICPSNGADVKGPTASANSVGTALGGKVPGGNGDFGEYLNCLPNGASHTITFSPSILRDPEHRTKFKAFLRGYIENGGTALQINMVDSDMLRDAQAHPGNYRNLLVRVTGYNAYFASIGRELQNEIITRESHNTY
jgi:formate C-acetyltransferase